MQKRVQIIKADGTVGYVTLTNDNDTDCTYCQACRDMRVSMYCPQHKTPKNGILRAIWTKLRAWFDPSYDGSEIIN